MSLIANVLIVLLIFAIGIYKLNKDYKLFYLLVYVYYQGLITSASLTYIETGIYISEQDRFSYFVGANFYFFIFFILSIQTLELIIRGLDKNVVAHFPKFKIGQKHVGYRIISISSILILSVLVMNLTLSSSPLFSDSVTRFSYWENSRIPILKTLFGNTATFLPFLFGITYLKRRRTAVIYLLVYIIYLILIGQKFSPIVRSLYSFFLPWVMTSNLKFKFNPFIFLKSYFTPIAFLLFGLVYLKYSIRNPFVFAGAETPFQAIIYRAFGLQAHLFWGSVEQFVYLGKPLSYDISELYKGMHTLMRHFWFGDPDHIQKSIENGFSFANAYPAVLLKIFPLWIVFPLHIALTGLIYAPMGWLLKNVVENKCWVVSFLAFQFFNRTGIAFIMGYYNKAIPGFLFCIALCVYAFLIYKYRIQRKIIANQ